MSESVLVVNFDKREWLNPFSFLRHEKLSRVDIADRVPWIVDLGTPLALQLLVTAEATSHAGSGGWAGDHVAIVGAYYRSPEVDGDRLAEACHRGHYREVSSTLLPAVLDIVTGGGLQYPAGSMFLNLDKAEGLPGVCTPGHPIDMRLCELLALVGGGRADRPPHVGRWAMDRVTCVIEPERQDPFRDIGYMFQKGERAARRAG